MQVVKGVKADSALELVSLAHFAPVQVVLTVVLEDKV